jgi:putative addiction module component (TIGR02574 family)
MSARSTELVDQILKLPPQERAQLAEQILDSLSPESARHRADVCG